MLNERALDVFESLDEVSDGANSFCHDVFESVGVLPLAGFDLVVDCLQFLLEGRNLCFELLLGLGEISILTLEALLLLVDFFDEFEELDDHFSEGFCLF